jgi:hypothetical protein
MRESGGLTGGLRRTEFKIGGQTYECWSSGTSANFEFCTSEPGSDMLVPRLQP